MPTSSGLAPLGRQACVTPLRTLLLIIVGAFMAPGLIPTLADPVPPAPGPRPVPHPAPAPVPPPAPKSPPAPTSTSPAPAAPAAPAKPPLKPGELKPYKDVITTEAKSQTGLFTVHRIEDKVYYEIPPSELGREMVWVTRIEELPANMGYGGINVGSRVVRWTRRNNKVYLHDVDYSVRAEGTGAMHRAVEAATLEPIILAFDVETEGKDKAPVIDVTRVFTTDIPEFPSKLFLGGGGVDASRTYIDQVKAFPTNIETKTMVTYSGSRSVTALIHSSLVLLPADPMKPRLFDSRVGYFTESFQDYGRPENREVDRIYILRHRLVKKDPNAEVSDPVKPLIYYISPEVPEKWRPYIKRGVEAWQPAFETAGFKNAILCRDAPSPSEDPDWDPEDARYNVIRWGPTTTENAEGQWIDDPRTGEIISARVLLWNNVLKLTEDWYFTQVSPLDVRAQRLPLPDALVGELMVYIVSHEVGHTLGLQHNFKASSSYTIADLRSPSFTAKYGDEASIMDYGRFNYVAQPGDHARLIPMIGPYDRFAIEWGYKPMPYASTPDDEKINLDAIAARQIYDPMLRFGNSHFEDPGQQIEDLGDDPIAATRLGLKNIARVAKLLVSATSKFGEDYDLLQEMYDHLFDQQNREYDHVLALIGGVTQTDYHAGRGGNVFRPVAANKQDQALRFLLANAFVAPRDLLVPGILYRIEPDGVVDSVLNSQRGLLGGLLAESRIHRMLDNQAMLRGKTYTVTRMVNDLQDGIWSELGMLHPVVDIYRRNLQRAYLQLLKPRLVGDGASQSDFRPIATNALRRLAREIDHALPLTTDSLTAEHLNDSRKAIDRILNPKV